VLGYDAEQSRVGFEEVLVKVDAGYLARAKYEVALDAADCL
jgi:hypothetical protein